MPFLRTKLYRPPVPTDHIHRPQLLKRLDEDHQRPLILVSAPAGYGKTTLVSCWLESNETPSAWLSLDENDNDLSIFLNYLISAIQTVFPHAVPKTEALVKAATLPPLRVLSTSLVNELDEIEQDIILVLDDFQLIHLRSVHDLLMELLRHPPRPLHLVIIGRRDPFLPISSLRARAQVTEIRIQDLCFTTAETSAYLEQMLGRKFDEAIATTWTEKTEGWVSGLRLAALSIRHKGESRSILPELHGRAPYVMEYLFNEVLSYQSQDIRDYLLSTAILDRFSAPLCDALSAPALNPGKKEMDSREFIALLKQENLFIVSLDAENRWFRYHHLFQQLLKNQLPRYRSFEEIAALHSRAAAWLAENNLIEEALRHALAADDMPFGVKLVEQHRHNIMDEEQWSRMKRITSLFPDQVVETHPELLMMKAWISYQLFRYSEMAEILDRIESMIAAGPSKTDKFVHLRGEIDALRGTQYYFEADGQKALSFTQKALDEIPLEHALAVGLAWLIRCAACQMVGDRAGALEISFGGIAEETPKKGSFDTRRFFGLCFVYWVEGELSALLQIAGQNLKRARKWRLLDSQRGSDYFMGIAYYQRNDLTSAEKHLRHVVDQPYVGHAFVTVHSCYALAQVYQSLGLAEKRDAVMEAANDFALQSENTHIIMTTRAFEAELALRQGRFNKARHWVHQFNPEPFRPMTWFYVPQLTLVKVLLAEGTTAGLQQAATLLKRLDDFVQSTHNTCARIEVLALQALLHDARGEGVAAMEKLTESLALAEPGGFIRKFVDLGPPMADLQKRLQKQNVAEDYIKRILADFSNEELEYTLETSNHDRLSPPPPPSPLSDVLPLVDPLTHRETDILELLAKRLQNKEIAENLCISPETVKTHLNNIYQKLGVANRRKAVKQAKDMGIV
jgi:ATP/maltotriose-dependent transcriptional regulator MalT